MFLRAIDIVHRIADGAVQPVPDARIAQHFGEAVGKVFGAAHTKMQAVLAVANLLGHAAYIGTDDRAAVMQRFLNDDGEFSHQIEGMTTQSTDCMRRGISAFW